MEISGQSNPSSNPFEHYFFERLTLFETSDAIGETDCSFEIFHEHLLQLLIPMTAHERVPAENIITLEWEISQLTRAMRASVRRGVEQDIQSHIINNLNSP